MSERNTHDLGLFLRANAYKSLLISRDTRAYIFKTPSAFIHIILHIAGLIAWFILSKQQRASLAKGDALHMDGIG